MPVKASEKPYNARETLTLGFVWCESIEQGYAEVFRGSQNMQGVRRGVRHSQKIYCLHSVSDKAPQRRPRVVQNMRCHW